jgi:hypothetical protein
MKQKKEKEKGKSRLPCAAAKFGWRRPLVN